MVLRRVASLLKQSETSWRNQVVELATLSGWMVYFLEYPTRLVRNIRLPNMNRQGKGFPDLTLLRPPRLVYVELKRDRGPQGGGEHDHVNPTEEQLRWLAAFGGVPGIEPYVWRPSDWDEVVRVLT